MTCGVADADLFRPEGTRARSLVLMLERNFAEVITVVAVVRPAVLSVLLTRAVLNPGESYFVERRARRSNVHIGGGEAANQGHLPGSRSLRALRRG